MTLTKKDVAWHKTSDVHRVYGSSGELIVLETLCLRTLICSTWEQDCLLNRPSNRLRQVDNQRISKVLYWGAVRSIGEIYVKLFRTLVANRK